MELKVWVEGLPRVVCGVHEQTTCKDVVRALAQALGRPGRYSLVQRWRDTQRTVAPSVCLLADLRRWGDYVGDVQLALCIGDTADSPAITSVAPAISDKMPNYRTAAAVPVVVTRLQEEPRRRVVGDRTNGVTNGHVGVDIGDTNSGVHRGRPLRRDDEDAAIIRMAAVAAEQRLNGGVINNNNGPANRSAAVTTVGGGGRQYSHQQQRQQHARTYSASRAMVAPTASSDVHRRDTSGSGGGDRGHTSLPRHHSSGGHRQQRSEPAGGVDFADPASAAVVRQLNGRPVVAVGNGGVRGHQGYQGHDDAALRDDLARQLAQQADALKRNLAAMLSLDKNIAEAEETLRRAERELAFDEGTARRLEERVEPELEELELVSWEGKLELEQQQWARVQAHHADTRALVVRLDDELTLARDQARHLERQLAEAARERDGRGGGGKRRVAETQQEARLRALNGALATARVEHEAHSDVLDSLDDELRRVDVALADARLRASALDSTADPLGHQRSLTDPTDKSSEDSGCLSRSSSSRSASSPLRRIIDQPSQLQGLAPSAAHPQGMWV